MVEGGVSAGVVAELTVLGAGRHAQLEFQWAMPPVLWDLRQHLQRTAWERREGLASIIVNYCAQGQ